MIFYQCGIDLQFTVSFRLLSGQFPLSFITFILAGLWKNTAKSKQQWYLQTGAVPAEEISGGHGPGDNGERRGSRGFTPSKFF